MQATSDDFINFDCPELSFQLFLATASLFDGCPTSWHLAVVITERLGTLQPLHLPFLSNQPLSLNPLPFEPRSGCSPTECLKLRAIAPPMVAAASPAIDALAFKLCAVVLQYTGQSAGLARILMAARRLSTYLLISSRIAECRRIIAPLRPKLYAKGPCAIDSSDAMRMDSAIFSLERRSYD